MDLVQRLTIFTKSEGITSSMLADTCGIPRPTVCQMLNRRNQKISAEIIGKIHKHYPQLSVMWLMFGEGEMKVNVGDEEQQNVFQSDLSPDSQLKMPEYHDSASNNSGLDSSIISMMSNSVKESENSNRPSITIPTDSTKQITNIIVMYSDNSFQVFQKSKF